MNKPNMAKFFKEAQMFISEHSPEILTGIGIAGMVTTTVLAVKETPKALQLIEEKKRSEHVDELTPVETVKACWKCYIPAAVTGVASMVCLIGAGSVNARRYAALTAAYKLSETTLDEYRAGVIKTIGEKKEKTVREQVSQDRIEQNPVSNKEVIFTGKGDTLLLEPASMRYFNFDIDKLKRIENMLNKRMIHDMFGSVSLSDFYDEIGLEHTDFSDVIGWHVDKGLIDIDFHPSMTPDKRPCLALYYNNRPTYGFDSVR